MNSEHEQAILWLWLAERQVPTHWDLIGASLCVAGFTTRCAKQPLVADRRQPPGHHDHS